MGRQIKGSYQSNVSMKCDCTAIYFLLICIDNTCHVQNVLTELILNWMLLITVTVNYINVFFFHIIELSMLGGVVWGES